MTAGQGSEQEQVTGLWEEQQAPSSVASHGHNSRLRKEWQEVEDCHDKESNTELTEKTSEPRQALEGECAMKKGQSASLPVLFSKSLFKLPSINWDDT